MFPKRGIALLVLEVAVIAATTHANPLFDFDPPLTFRGVTGTG
jgi:hypothetical protein